MPTLIHPLELTEPVKAIEQAEQYDAVHVYLQWRGQVIARMVIANDHRPISLRRLLAEIAQRHAKDILPHLTLETGGGTTTGLGEELATLIAADHLESPDHTEFLKTLSASIILCTRDRPQSLEQCLQGLARHRSVVPFEIIVVDNNPASGEVAPLAARYPVRYVAERRPGLSYARNAGIKAARGQIIVCTDDDVVCTEGWLDNLLKPFARPEVLAVTGATLPKELNAYSAELFEEYGGLFRGFGRVDFTEKLFQKQGYRYLPTWRIGATANAAFRAELFSDPRFGPFNEALGAGTPAGVGEDTLLFYKILRAGYVCAYEPSALVYHSHRQTLPALRQQLFHYSMGHTAYHLTTLVEEHDLRALLYLLVILPGKILKRVKWQAQKYTFYPFSLLGLETLGYLLGPWAYLEALHRAKKQGRTTAADIARAWENRPPLLNVHAAVAHSPLE